MWTGVEGYYENGKVTLKESPPFAEGTEVVVMFPSKANNVISKKRKLGLLEGKITVADDFDEPIEDLKDYM